MPPEVDPLELLLNRRGRRLDDRLSSVITICLEEIGIVPVVARRMRLERVEDEVDLAIRA